MRILQVIKKFVFEPLEIFDGNVVTEAVRHGPDDDDLIFDFHRHVLRLLQNFC